VSISRDSAPGNAFHGYSQVRIRQWADIGLWLPQAYKMPELFRLNTYTHKIEKKVCKVISRPLFSHVGFQLLSTRPRPLPGLCSRNPAGSLPSTTPLSCHLLLTEFL